MIILTNPYHSHYRHSNHKPTYYRMISNMIVLITDHYRSLQKYLIFFGLLMLINDGLSMFDADKLRNRFLSTMMVSAEHRSGSYRRNQLSALYKAPCLAQSDCRFDNTQCNLAAKKCQCKQNFIQVDSFVNRSYITHLAMTCLPIARLDERCISDLQCIVDYSECKLTTETFQGINRTVHQCKCSHGHELKDDQATVIFDGHSYRFRPSCDPERLNSSSWIITVIMITVLVLLILISTFVLIIRYQRMRQPYNQSTVTSITSQGLNSHGMGHHQMGSSSPPPMGSAEAEFQNDFIQVFPMHHLEPMPDKNAHAFIIR